MLSGDATLNFCVLEAFESALVLPQVSTEDVIKSLRQQSRGAQTFSSQYRGKGSRRHVYVTHLPQLEFGFLQMATTRSQLC